VANTRAVLAVLLVYAAYAASQHVVLVACACWLYRLCTRTPATGHSARTVHTATTRPLVEVPLVPSLQPMLALASVLAATTNKINK
jgi:hypothetical protein